MEFILREWREKDLASLVEYANNYNIAKFLTNQFPYPYTQDDGRRYLAMATAKTDGPLRFFAIEVAGEAAGAIGIFPQTDIHAKNAEIGYWLAEKYWGKGIVTNAIREITRYGFETFDITRIFARPFSSNPASQRVLEKAGFVCEARLVKALYKNGEYLDEMIYTKRKEE